MATSLQIKLNSDYRHDGMQPSVWLSFAVPATETGRPLRS